MDQPVAKKGRFHKLYQAWLFFLHYVKLLIFLAILCIGVFFIYKWLNPPPPFEIGNQMPSQVLKPIMSSNLPLLLGNLQGVATIPQLDLKAVEKAINLKKTKNDPLQPAWKIADELCSEISTIDTERKMATESLLVKNSGGKLMWLESLRSKFEAREIALRRVLYLTDPEKNWADFTSQHRKTIKKLYLQILVAEKASASSPRQQLICPLCKGEGRIMVRRPINGTITDVSSACPLCIGSGGRNLKIPVNAKKCPDCGGFGRRVVLQVSHEGEGKGKGIKTIRTLSYDEISNNDGIFGEPPNITSCSRCLSRGYILQPGSQ